MKAIWTASISWGLVNVPVKLFSAVEEHDIKCHQVHVSDGGKIRYKKVCEGCGEAVDTRDIGKAYQGGEGVKILTDDDLATLREGNNRAIEVLEFVAASEVNPLLFDRVYYLDVAQPEAVKAYALLARTLAQSSRVAIVRFSMRGKTHLAALRVVGKGNALAVHTLRWSDELREPDFPSLNTTVEVSDAELKVAGQLVESMASEGFNPDKYRDTYADELRELIASKGVEQVGEAPADVGDLIAKLEASVSATKPRKRGRKIADKPVRRGVKVAS